MIYLKQFKFGWPDQPSSGLDATNLDVTNLIKMKLQYYIVVNVVITYFEIKRSGGNDEQNQIE